MAWRRVFVIHYDMFNVINRDYRTKLYLILCNNATHIHVKLNAFTLPEYVTLLNVYQHNRNLCPKLMGLHSLSGKTFYRKIWWSPAAANSGVDFSYRFEIWQAPVKFQSDAIIITSILRLQDFMGFGGKTSYRLVNIGPGSEDARCSASSPTRSNFKVILETGREVIKVAYILVQSKGWEVTNIHLSVSHAELLDIFRDMM